VRIVQVTLTFDVFIENATKKTALKRVAKHLEKAITDMHLSCGEIKGFGMGSSAMNVKEMGDQ